MNLTINEKVQIIRLTGRNERNFTEVARMFNDENPNRHVSVSTVSRINRLFDETGK